MIIQLMKETKSRGKLFLCAVMSPSQCVKKQPHAMVSLQCNLIASKHSLH